MSTLITLALAALVCSAAVVLEWVVLRTRYQKAMAQQRARHLQQRQIASQHLEQARRQIGQLQHDLAAAKLQAKRHTTVELASAQSRSRAKEALQRALEDASATWRRLPPDGFADTLPSPQYPHDAELLLR
jgi:biopolymer transport protein ExbB/TolQ